jgi:hypothetical protein
MDDFVCYCFEYTVFDIERDFKNNGRSTIMERIAAEKNSVPVNVRPKIPKAVDVFPMSARWWTD